MLHGEALPAAADCGCAGSGGFFFLSFCLSNLFRISNLGFRISCLVAAGDRDRLLRERCEQVADARGE